MARIVRIGLAKGYYARKKNLDLSVKLIKVRPTDITGYELHQDPQKIELFRKMDDLPPIWIAYNKILDGHHRLHAKLADNAPFIWAYEVDPDTYNWLKEMDMPDLDIVELLAKVNKIKITT